MSAATGIPVGEEGDRSSDLCALLWPKSVAIIGASADPKSIRGRPLEYLLQRKYAGAIYLVSRTSSELRGIKVYPSMRSLPERVDLALIAVRAAATREVLEEVAASGAKFAICFGSGFAESGDAGAALQTELMDLVGRSGLRVCGPNTAGFYNVKGEIPATFARNVDMGRSVTPSHRSATGTVSIVAQSGGLGFALSDRCVYDHGLRVSYVIGTGNEADLESLDFVDYVLSDPDTRVVLLLVESFKHAKRLKRVAARARRARKPIVVAKFGRTAAGARAVGSHAGRLTGSDRIYDALFRRLALLRVEDEESMTDLAAVFSLCPPLLGRRVGILTTSGGAGIWMADACETAGLEVPVLDAPTRATIAEFVPEYGAVHNPVDLTAQVTINPGSSPGTSPMIGALRALLESSSVDAVVLVANLSDGSVLSRETDGLRTVQAASTKPFLLYSHAPLSIASRQLVESLGLVCLPSTQRVAAAIRCMAEYAELVEADEEDGQPGDPLVLPSADVAALRAGLTEHAAKSLLARHGIPVTRERLVHAAEEAVGEANALGGCVALKVQSRDILHKSEIDGVRLGLSSPDAVRHAYHDLLTSVRVRAPQAAIEGVLVQEMASGTHELAVGVMQDPDFGPVMMVGMGGIYVEILDDVVIEPLPVTKERAIRMLRRLRGWKVLSGARGRDPADVEAVAQLMARLSVIVEAADGACKELDLNPVFVRSAGHGAVVVDALIVGSDEPSAEASKL